MLIIRALNIYAHNRAEEEQKKRSRQLKIRRAFCLAKTLVLEKFRIWNSENWKRPSCDHSHRYSVYVALKFVWTKAKRETEKRRNTFELFNCSPSWKKYSVSFARIAYATNQLVDRNKLVVKTTTDTIQFNCFIERRGSEKYASEEKKKLLISEHVLQWVSACDVFLNGKQIPRSSQHSIRCVCALLMYSVCQVVFHWSRI